MRFTKHSSQAFGFTLVEVAICMILIGLLIGGILKGSELVENSRVTKTVDQVKSYKAAYEHFKDKYGGLPGDMPGARTMLPNCTAATNCVNGNGDNRIGTQMSTGARTSQANTTASPAVETSMFWKHLALADFISGINSNAPVNPAEWNVTHPSAPFGGGYVIISSSSTSGIAMAGNFLRMQQTLIGNHPTTQGTMPLTPAQAMLIDQKMDDGIPRSGNVLGDNIDGTSDSGLGAGCEGNKYGTSNSAKACIQLYRIE